MLRPTIANSADRDRRERIERVRNELTEEHLNPILLAAHRGDARGDARPRRVELPRALRQVQLPPRRPRRAVPRVPRLDRGAVRGRGRPLLRANVGVGLAEARALGRRARLPRRRAGTRRLPGRPDAARARGDALGARDRPPRAGERPPRRRGAAAQDAARVLLADRGAGQGDARHPADRRARTTGARSSTRPATPSTSRTRAPSSRSRSAASATAPSPRAGRC